MGIVEHPEYSSPCYLTSVANFRLSRMNSEASGGLNPLKVDSLGLLSTEYDSVRLVKDKVVEYKHCVAPRFCSTHYCCQGSRKTDEKNSESILAIGALFTSIGRAWVLAQYCIACST